MAVTKILYRNGGLQQAIDYITNPVNLAMQYWTVNDEADLAYLASVGADALITDYPDRAAAVLQGMG